MHHFSILIAALFALALTLRPLPASASPASHAASPPHPSALPAHPGGAASHRPQGHAGAGTLLPRLFADVDAYAQSSPRWLLLPSAGKYDAGGLNEEDKDRLAHVLRNLGVYVLAFDEARALFAVNASAEPSSASETDIDIVAERAQAALLHVATGEHEEAKKAISDVLQRAEVALESLNRKADSARNVLNACLYLVRAMLESGAPQEAASKVRECRRLVPDIAPDPYDHPPKVMRLVQETEKQLASERTASLTVESHPTQCSTYINGRKLGRTPYTVRDLPPGEYRVQVECNEKTRGRVHRVILGAETTRMHINARFDNVVRTQGELTLEYLDADEENRYRHGDAIRAAEVVDATESILITPEDRNTVRLDRIDIRTRKVIATTRVGLKVETRERLRRISEAARALHRGESVDLSTDRAKAIRPWASPESPADAFGHPGADAEGAASQASPEKTQGSHRLPLTRANKIGLALVGVGVASFASSWVTYARLKTHQSDLSVAGSSDPDFLDRQERFQHMTTATLGLSGGGFALMAASMPFALPYIDEGAASAPALGTPWWSWVSGAVGLGLAGYASYELARSRFCVDTACTTREPTRTLGGSLMLHSGALMSMPLTHLMRHWLGANKRAAEKARAQNAAGSTQDGPTQDGGTPTTPSAQGPGGDAGARAHAASAQTLASSAGLSAGHRGVDGRGQLRRDVSNQAGQPPMPFAATLSVLQGGFHLNLSGAF